MAYKEKERRREIRLIENSDIFDGCQGRGEFMGSVRKCVLSDSSHNLYKSIRNTAVKYFMDNGISWWREKEPTGHVLSSQIACLNHLMPIMDDKDAVLAIINGIKNEFTEVLPLNNDKEPHYISFEVVGSKDYLKEGTQLRGANCTSIDSMILARHKSGKNILIPIEWKYTEAYSDSDKAKGKPGRTRQSRYNHLISNSGQLVRLEVYRGSIYYQEPFYQLMRQTLLAEQIIAHKDTEVLKADDFVHIHVIPKNNTDLLDKIYKVSGKTLEDTWRSRLKDNSKYLIIDPSDLFAPLKGNEKYKDLISYLETRYWDD